MTSKELQIGLVGFGNMGRLHAQQLKYLPEVAVRIVVDANPQNGEAASSFYKDDDVQICNDLNEALALSDMDAWVVASSTDTHIPVAEQLLRHGATLLLEKPISRSFQEAEQIRPLVREDSSNLMMGHILLWHREFLAVKGLLSETGAIKSIFASRQRSRDHRVRYPGESPFSLTMVHDLYSVFALLSGTKPHSLSAQQRKHEESGIDLAHAQLFWPGDLFASFHANFLVPDGLPGGGNIDELQVVGASGLIRLSYESGQVIVLKEGARREIEVARPSGAGLESFFDDALRSELESFVQVVRHEATVPVGARYDDACQIQGWIEGFKRSAESGVVQQC